MPASIFQCIVKLYVCLCLCTAKCETKKSDGAFCGAGKVYDSSKGQTDCSGPQCTTAGDALKCCKDGESAGIL